MIVVFLPRFAELIDSTPALRAAWNEIATDRIVTVAARGAGRASRRSTRATRSR